MKEGKQKISSILPGKIADLEEKREEYYKDLTSEEDAKTVLDGVPRSRGWSVAALILGILAIVLSVIPFFGYLHGIFGPIFGFMAVIASLVSGRNLGYFDGIGIAGIILGAIGCVFGATALLFGAFFG